MLDVEAQEPNHQGMSHVDRYYAQSTPQMCINQQQVPPLYNQANHQVSMKNTQ